MLPSPRLAPWLRCFPLASVLLLTACATGGAPAVPVTGRSDGYLGRESLPQTAIVLPAAPQPGSARYRADREIFRETRKLHDSPRWQLATADADGALPRMLEHFSCAVGVPLDAARLPELVNLLDHAGADAAHAGKPAKEANARQRPFLLDDGPVCESKDELAKSFDYPSGHVGWGWTVGLILMELAPDRATEIGLRARAFADSRVVCGAHNHSAVAAGTMNGAMVVAALHAVPAFRRDAEAARRELAGYRHRTPPMAANVCAAERALIRPLPY